MQRVKLAMDKSLRTVDNFGKMRIEVSNISKSAVNPYRGNEIPNGVAMGLDMDKVYQLLRDPEELAKAADTFNGLPLLSRHVPVTADEPAAEFVVGSTGTDAVFEEPYLRNSLVIWEANAIAGVKTNQQRELSSAYSYDADMTPGKYNGVPYDGIMRNIKGNHVALVEVGRAGNDVIVMDSKPLEKPKMKVGKLSANRKTLLAACLLASVGPMLAQDAQPKDLTAIAGSVDSLKSAKDKQSIMTALKPLVAQDAELEGVIALLDALGANEEEVTMDDDADMSAKIAAASPEVKAQIMALLGGTAMDADDEDDKKKDMIDKPAMDAAIKAAETATVARMQAIHTAVREVEPLIGTIAIAQDSAEAVYKLALDHAKVDTDGVHPSAFRSMVKMLPTAGAQKPRQVIAQDGADDHAAMAQMFPNAGKLKGGV